MAFMNKKKDRRNKFMEKICTGLRFGPKEGTSELALSGEAGQGDRSQSRSSPHKRKLHTPY